jgi:flagellar basal-body rod modification protein FlgD
METSALQYLSQPSGDYASDAKAADKTLGKDDFLQLLIAKLSNQDPMNPMDDSAFVAQLAQFSSLEQLSNMNDNLEQDIQWNYLLSQTISNTMSTSLIGREVRADSSTLYLETAGDSDIALHLGQTATEVTVTIQDENGNTVRTIRTDALDAGDHVVHWDGANDSGAQVPSGTYTISVSAVDAEGEEFSPEQYVEGKVTGVAYRDGMAMLVVNGQEIPLSSVREVKEG